MPHRNLAIDRGVDTADREPYRGGTEIRNARNLELADTYVSGAERGLYDKIKQAQC